MSAYPQLDTYVLQARASGMPDEAIGQALITAGYPLEIIQQVLPSIPASTPVSTNQPNAPKTKRLALLIAGVLLIIGTIVSIVMLKGNHPTQVTRSTSSGANVVNSSFDGKTFSYTYPKNWKKQTADLAWDARLFTPDYTPYGDSDQNAATHGSIKQGAEIDIHIGRYGAGGLNAFKKDLEAGNQKGFYAPISEAENITQTTINGKSVITYNESTDNREVAILFLDSQYAVQCSYLRPYTTAANDELQSTTIYQQQFDDIVSSFIIK